MASYQESLNRDVPSQVEKEMMMYSIYNEDIAKISSNPLLYFSIFKEKNSNISLDLISNIDGLIVRSIFLCFEIMSINKSLFN